MCIRGLGLCCLSASLLTVNLSQAKEPTEKKNTQVVVAVKFVDVDQAVVEQLRHQGLLGQESKGKDISSLNGAEMNRFQEVIYSDIHSNVLQAPQLTEFSGKTAAINIVDEKRFVTGLEIVYRDGHIEYRPKKETVPLGIRIGLRSAVLADRRRVRVHLDALLTSLVPSEAPRFPITTPAPKGMPGTVTHYIEQPNVLKLAVNQTMVVPDGNTAVLIGPTYKRTGFNRSGPPFVSDLPLVGRLFCTVGYASETHHLLVLVTPRILAPQPRQEKASRTAAIDSRAICHRRSEMRDNEFRTLVLGQYRGNDPQCSEEPDEARILRAMLPAKRLPGVYQESRDNIQIVTERLVDKIDPPRFFPLVGRAQLHHCWWNCTVYYTETIACGYPFVFRCTQPRTQVVNVDTDHLHMFRVDKTQTK